MREVISYFNGAYFFHNILQLERIHLTLTILNCTIILIISCSDLVALTAVIA